MPARLRVAAVAATLAAQALGSAPTAWAVSSYDEVVEIVFPTDPAVASFFNDYDSARSGGRVHMATDIMVPKMTPAYAAADGVVCYITGIDEPEPSWGYHLRICGDDGIVYDYIHMNNDTPGTDDGMGGPENAYAPGIRRGVRVAAGQLVAWAGDSGNAENTGSHVHFEMESPDVVSPYGTQRMNPYPSLIAALEAGRISDGTAVVTDPKGRVAGPDRVATALAVSEVVGRRASSVVLVRSDVPWPAVVGGPLAAVAGGVVLTTGPGELDARVASRIAELGAGTVYVVGPLEVDVEAALTGTDVTEVVRIEGADRYATSAMVAELVWQATGAQPVGDAEAAPSDAPDPAPPPPLDGTPLPWTGDLGEVTDAISDVADGSRSLAELEEDLRSTLVLLDDHGPMLVASANRDRTEGVDLDGAVVATDIAVELVGVDPREVDSVSFWYDDDTDRRSDRRERYAPYDANGSDDDGPIPFALDGFAPGTNTVVARVRWLDGSRTTVRADFDVVGSRGVPTVTTRQAILALGDHPVESRSWPDALMASYYGSARFLPVLLTPPDQADRRIADVLDGTETTWVIGGPGAIADAILDDLGLLSGTAFHRLAGTSRYLTALAVVQDLVDRSLVTTDRVWVATGHNWPDATAAGPAVAGQRDLLVLLNGTGAGGDDEVRAWLSDHAGDIGEVTALGGPAAVANSVLTAAAVAIT